MTAKRPELQDPGLFRQQCYIDGRWQDALDDGTVEVTTRPPAMFSVKFRP